MKLTLRRRSIVLVGVSVLFLGQTYVIKHAERYMHLYKKYDGTDSDMAPPVKAPVAAPVAPPVGVPVAPPVSAPMAVTVAPSILTPPVATTVAPPDAPLSLRLTDPAHSSRLSRFTNMSDFPLPKFHGCTTRNLCQFSNVCFSRHDGIMIFDVPELAHATNDTDWYNLTNGKFSAVTPPRLPVLIPKERYSTLENVYFAEGDMFVMNCWRQSMVKYNPAHMLMGMGKLFVHSSGYYDPNNTHSFNMLLYHHCAPTAGWAWGEMVEKLFWDDAVAKGTIQGVSPTTANSDDQEDTKLFLPVTGGALDRKDAVVCGETVYMEPFSIKTYLGSNPSSVVTRWQSLVSDFAETKLNTNVDHDDDSTGNNTNSSSALPLCNRNLRIAVWRRTEGSALRLLTNLGDIQRLVQEYSDLPLSIVTASAATSPEEQVLLFRSFDVLITPHGSHLANMIFGRNSTVYIEVASVYYDDAPTMNGATFASEWISSFGHLPYNNSDLLAKMTICSKSRAWGPGSACNRSTRLRFIQSDLLVNTTILRADLDRAIARLCPAS